MARYKFVCCTCKFECISGIGKEVGFHFSRVTMVCKSCLGIDGYKVGHPVSINSEITAPPVCSNCHLSNYLYEWDGRTCPHCHGKMRAIGGDIDADKSIRYR